MNELNEREYDTNCNDGNLTRREARIAVYPTVSMTEHF
jgi:hypothetical protein